MTVSAAAPITPVANDSGALGRASLATNFNTFLSLLTTQLKNQDPMAPLDSNQFTQQLTQMTGVEQQLLTNDLLKQLVGNTASGVSAAVSLIGKEVRATSDTAALNGGQAKWTYKLDKPAADLKVEVLDSNGRVVHAEAPTDGAAGDHAFTWNGKDQYGNKLADGGVYTLRITAADSAGGAVAATSYVQGLVTGVEQANGQTLVTVNGGQVDWTKITTINQPTATSTTPGTTPAA